MFAGDADAALCQHQLVAFWRLRSLLLVAAAGASLTGCSSADTPLAAVGARHSLGSPDAAFLSSMSDHEKATLGITRLAKRRALRRELRGIARTMTSEEQANLSQIESLAQGPPSGGARPPRTWRTPRSAMADLARVKDATSFDHEFMRTMVEQNQRAIAIASHEVRFGKDPAVKGLAAQIVAARKKELDRIRGWLRLWYGDVQPGPGPLETPGGGGDQTSPRVPPL